MRKFISKINFEIYEKTEYKSLAKIQNLHFWVFNRLESFVVFQSQNFKINLKIISIVLKISGD